MPKYDPPKDWDQRVEYDKQWERERASDDYEDGKYRPPSPGFFNSEEQKEKTWAEREEYDKQWERERAKEDYHR